jgi:hypothetical protein
MMSCLAQLAVSQWAIAVTDRSSLSLSPSPVAVIRRRHLSPVACRRPTNLLPLPG